MSDLKITGLTADTAPTVDDLVPTVNDPGGTPANRKVTLANLAKGLALILNHQGGSATDWSSPGTTTRDKSATHTFIQTGTIAINAVAGTDTTITFPTAFSQVPIVFAMQTVTVSANVSVNANTITASTFKLRVIQTSGASDAFSWIAIGQ